MTPVREQAITVAERVAAEVEAQGLPIEPDPAALTRIALIVARALEARK
jgi:hypothetical protein